MSTSAPRSLTLTLALFAAGSFAITVARPRWRSSLRELVYPTRTASAPRASGPLPTTPSARVEASPPAVPPPLPPRWSARAPADRRITAIANPCISSTASDGGTCASRALDPFFAKLASLERGQRPRVRVSHIGDSIVADDKITARIRSRLQREFGDRGIGWLYAQRPTRWYHPRNVRYEGRGLDTLSVVDEPDVDPPFGPAGAAFVARTNGATASIELTARATVTLYASDPSAVSTRLDEGPWQPMTAPIALATEGRHLIEMRVDRQGSRLYGLSVERDAPGVIVDNLGLVSSSSRALARQDSAAWETALAALAPDLVIVSLGTNDSTHGPIPLAHRPALEESHVALFSLVKRVAGACLVLLPPDGAEERGGPLATRASLGPILEAQRRAAERAGCALWDTYGFMGGRNAIIRWHEWGWAEADHTHLTDGGAARIADALSDALLSARDDYLARHP